ncbi:kinase-like domain-containing protein [Mycena leptocephala]|nr:kinase-like domain-containing protein [Mycena leptocephala]
MRTTSTCFTLSGLEKVGQQVAGGGFGDIWKGLVGGQAVAVKSMRQFMGDDVKASIKKFGREALIWRQLSHPNLFPFFGLYVLDNRLCLISPWMDNGDLKRFLGNAPSGIDRVSLIADIATGLEYLHSKHVVHGDLKAANILVTPSGRACITDFGLSSIVDELSLKMTCSSHSGRAGTVRYQAPELLSNDSSNHFGSDVYAFACVCYEILTGKVPFFEVSNEAAVIFKVMEGGRPSRLETISPEELWVLLDNCWQRKADKRPTMTTILRRLKRPPIGAKLTQSRPDWDETSSARFRRSVQEWPLLPSIPEIERRISSNTLDGTALVDLSTLDLGSDDSASQFNPRPDHTETTIDQSLPNGNAGQETLSPLSSRPVLQHSSSSNQSHTAQDSSRSTSWTEETRIPYTPPGPVSGPSSSPSAPLIQIHPWLNIDCSAILHFDLAPESFLPLRLIGENPSERRPPDKAELRRSAFQPPLATLRIVHPRIPFWPIDFALPTEGAASSATGGRASTLSLADVLAGIHHAMHQCITHQEWALLAKTHEQAVIKAFRRRYRAEAYGAGWYPRSCVIGKMK